MGRSICWARGRLFGPSDAIPSASPVVVVGYGLWENIQSQLDRLFKKSRRRLIDLKTKVEKAQFEYQNLMEAEPLDEKAVNRQFAQLEKARSKLASERSRFLVEVRKILGHNRFQQLKQIYRQQ